jgi:2-amino-4-hydroxy-6-hydroxymethyldihydropteridine diphosphokinase
VYESEPWGFTDQPRFLNMAALVRTTLTPAELLPVLKAIETRLGRVPGRRMGPRVIDLDILLYGDERIESADLQVPHPGILARAFVLAPLLDLDIGLRHPVTGEQLADSLFALEDTALVPLGTAADVLQLTGEP